MGRVAGFRRVDHAVIPAERGVHARAGIQENQTLLDAFFLGYDSGTPQAFSNFRD
jgi:hypothetical protein